MLVGRYDDAAARARLDVDVRVDAPLADEPQGVKTFEKGLTDLRTLANQYEDLGVRETRGEGVGLLNMIVPDRDFVSVQFAKALKRTKRVEVIIEDRNLHASGNLRRMAPTACFIIHVSHL